MPDKTVEEILLEFGEDYEIFYYNNKNGLRQILESTVHALDAHYRQKYLGMIPEKKKQDWQGANYDTASVIGYNQALADMRKRMEE